MIENKIEKSGLVNLDLETFYPEGKRMEIDLKHWLWQEQILREKEFRGHAAAHDWDQYQDAFVAVHCSADAIIPVWSFMLVSAQLHEKAAVVYAGNPEAMETFLFRQALADLNPADFAGKKVLVKGCSNKPVPASAYLEITRILAPHVSSLMYGEACSTVPVYKKKK